MTEAAPPAPRIPLLPLAFTNFTIGAGAFFVIGLIGPLTASLGLSKVQAGWIMGAYAFGYALSSPILVSLTGGRPRRDVILTGMGLFIAASVLSAFSWNAPTLYAARTLAAVGAGLVTPVVAGVAAASSAPERRGVALSIVFSGMTLSQVVGVPAGAFIGFTFGIEAAFFTAALLCALAGAWIVLSTSRNAPFAPQSLRTLGRTLLSPPHLVGVTLTVTIAMSGYVAFTFMGPLAEMRLGMGRDGVALMLLAAGLGAFGGSIGGGFLVDRLGATPTLVLSLVGQVIASPLLTLVPFGLFGGMALAFFWSLVGWSFTVPQQTRLIALDPGAQGVMLALNAAGIYLGSGIGSGLAGLIADGYGTEATGVAGGLLGVLALAHLALSERLARRHASRQPEPRRA